MAQVHESISKVMGEIPAIGKDKRNQQQGFNYRGIDDVYNVMSPLMSKHCLVMVPQIIESTRQERPGKSGGVLTFVTLKIKYRFFGSDGSTLEDELCPIVIGEGMDSGDKATNKAMSIAHKYAMFQMFCIPTEEMDDPDADSPQPTIHQEQPYNLDGIKSKMSKMQTVAAITDYLRGLTIPEGHSQRPAITKLYMDRKAQLDATASLPDGPTPITDDQRKYIQAHFNGWERDRRLANLSDFLRRKIESVNDMSKDEASAFIDAVESEKEQTL